MNQYDEMKQCIEFAIQYKESKRFSGEVITICGSMKFAAEMIEQEKILTKEGYVVLMPVMELINKTTEEEREIYRKAHKQKIGMADSILVINKDGYVGRHTADEIETASKLRKRICFLENSEQ